MNIARAVNRLVVSTEGFARLILVAALLLVLYYAADREPPFSVLSVEPAAARAGDVITLRAKVRREADRHCNAAFSRYVFDASGARFDISRDIASAEMISTIERISPGALTLKFYVPIGAEPGPANLKTVLDYYCNQTHKLWPITVTTDMPFTVLPPP